MSLAVWHEVELTSLVVAELGWHYDDSTALEKLATSLRRHGQLQAIVVRTAPDGSTQVVNGRKLLQAMRALGWTRGMVADIGAVDYEASQRLALDLELRFEVDFAKLAVAVAVMLEAGASTESLAGASPFTAERIGYFRTLASFDWSQFSDALDGQVALDWGLEEAVLSAGEPAMALEVPVEALPVPKVPMPAHEPVIEPDLLAPVAEPFPFPGMAAAIPPQPLKRPLPEAPEPALIAPPEEDEDDAPKRKRKSDPQPGLF